jgi:guanine nucleotide exchange factor VAV
MLMPHPWYVGELNRDEATRMLSKMPNGTFLIRVSNTGNRKGEHALSIRFGPVNPVKHIKVQRSADGMYFLVDCKMFRGIPELVQYYQANSLERSFPEVPCTLGTPYKVALNPPPRERPLDAGVVGYGLAQYDFSPMEPNQIAFKVGDRIAILSKSRGNRGWWKGRIDGRVGFFPSEYVTEV